MSKYLKKIFQTSILIFLVLSSLNLYGQNFNIYKTPLENSVIVGIGPSLIFADNGGVYNKFEFNINPSVTIAYDRKINHRFDLRVNTGYQKIQGLETLKQNVLDFWNSQSSAENFSGRISYFDVMPVFKLLPTNHVYLRPQLNLYSGIGLGVLMSNVDLEYRNQNVSNHKITSLYVPLRFGMSYTIGPKTDLMLEGTMLYSFTDNIDGNENYNKFDDHFFQAQLMIKRYFNTSKSWK